jgi:hypothetical protein
VVRPIVVTIPASSLIAALMANENIPEGPPVSAPSPRERDETAQQAPAPPEMTRRLSLTRKQWIALPILAAISVLGNI